MHQRTPPPRTETNAGIWWYKLKIHKTMKKKFILTIVDVMQDRATATVFNSMVQGVREFNNALNQFELDAFSEVGEDSVVAISKDGGVTISLIPISQPE